MKDYINKHMGSKNKPTLKTDVQRKRFLKEKGIKLIKHPSSGEYMVAVESGVQMMSGKRLSASKVKEGDFTGDKEAAKESFAKAQSAVSSHDKVNTKARV